MKVAVIGECMVELYEDKQTGLLKQGFGGDTFNCAVYLKRMLKDFNVEYITILGYDKLSNKMIEFIKEQDLGVSYIEQIEDYNAGLYLINTKEGERSFTYYRSNSAARKLFDTKNAKALCKSLESFDMLYFSAITLAIMTKEGRKTFFNTLKKLKKKGIKIAFDSNYRPKLYKNVKEAKKLYLKALKYSDIFLPSLDDEFALWENISSTNIIKRAKNLACKEIVVKCGSENILFNKKNKIKEIKVKKLKFVVDTTAAGDSFNGTYLANRIKGYSRKKSINEAKNIATKVIMTQGAIIPKEES